MSNLELGYKHDVIDDVKVSHLMTFEEYCDLMGYIELHVEEVCPIIEDEL